MANRPSDPASAERRPGAGTDPVMTAPVSKAPIPTSLRTARLLLRPWTPADAQPLQPILAANQAHLGPWIPAHVSAAIPLPELAARLAGFADDFAAGRGFRFAMLTRDGSRLLGEADLFPRTAEGRVPLAEADRVELGYWLDAGATGQGFATEAARALIDLAATLPGVSHVEIRCEAANAPSAAVPRRLGFVLADTVAADSVVSGEAPVALQIWTSPLERRPSPDGHDTRREEAAVVTVRLATASDIPDLVELMQEFYAESSYPLDRGWAARAFSDLIAEPSRGAVWLMEIDGAVAGHVVLSVRFAMEFGGLIAYVDDLFVRPPYRRLGAARAGMDALVAECRRRGCRSIQVEVDPGNTAACSLYRRYGLAAGTDGRQLLSVTLR